MTGPDAILRPMPATDFLVRTSDQDSTQDMHLSHPLNERSEIFMRRLSDRCGLTHLGVSLARVPPGKESFALHTHTVHEEWIYILSGQGRVRIDDEDLEVRAGDFVGFPARGPAHLVCNTGEVELVYLQGGDRREGDRGRFPELGLVAYQHDEGHMALVAEGQVELRPFSDWLAAPPASSATEED